jgi:hypothetical protein
MPPAGRERVDSDMAVTRTSSEGLGTLVEITTS